MQIAALAEDFCKMKTIFGILALAFVASASFVKKDYIPTEFQPLSQELIDFVNGLEGSTWKAGRSFEGVSVNYLKGLMGVIPDPNGPRLKGKQDLLSLFAVHV